MENRDIKEIKDSFYTLLKFILSKSPEYWSKHPDDFYSVNYDINEIHRILCPKKHQQNS